MNSLCVFCVLRIYLDTAALLDAIKMIESLVITTANPAVDSADFCQPVSGPALWLSSSNMPTRAEKGTGCIWSPHIYTAWQRIQTGLQQIL